MIGASGAVLALLPCTRCIFRGAKCFCSFFSRVFLVAVAIFGAISLFGSFGAWGNVSHLTHLGGIAVGFLYVKFFPSLKDIFEQAKSRAAEARRSAEAAGSIADKTYFETSLTLFSKKYPSMAWILCRVVRSAPLTRLHAEEENAIIPERFFRSRKGSARVLAPLILLERVPLHGRMIHAEVGLRPGNEANKPSPQGGRKKGVRQSTCICKGARTCITTYAGGPSLRARLISLVAGAQPRFSMNHPPMQRNFSLTK